MDEETSFAEELGPNKVLQKKVRQQEGMAKRQEEDWGSPPFYVNQEEFVQKKHKRTTQVTRDVMDDLWGNDQEDEHEDELEIDDEFDSPHLSRKPNLPSQKGAESAKFSHEVQERTGSLGKIDRKHDIFFQGTEPQEFRVVLSEVQEYISKNYSQLITENPEDSREQMKRYISKYILDKKVVVEGRNTEELLEELYVEMAEYGFLTKYVFGTGMVEIELTRGMTLKCSFQVDAPKN